MRKKNHSIIDEVRRRSLLPFCLLALLSLGACSTLEHVPDGDQLFVGLTKIEYSNYEKNENFIATQEEVEAALATAPNGALFGSSYYRTPFPFRLWIWNAFSSSETKFGKWMAKAFGKAPVLMSQVNPALRASVAQSLLRNHGYFHGQVSYEAVPQKNPKKSKIGYQVNLGPLALVDSISYENFPVETDSLLSATADEAKIKVGDPFTVAALDAERSRVSTLFRNNGYYYYQSGYASYIADTLAVPGKVQLRLQMADNVPEVAKRKWYIGRVNIDIRKSFRQTLTDSLVRRAFTVRYSGKQPPLRPRVIMADMRLRRRQLFSYDNYLETVSRINATGLFSMVDFSFTPRDTTTAGCDTLDLRLNCVLDKPYDSYLETNFVNRTIGRMGPEVKIGFTKRNAFRGGERFDVNLHGSYEWQTGSRNAGMNAYEYGADASLEFPRIIAPFFGGNRTRRSSTPNTQLSSASPLGGGMGSTTPRRRRRRFFTTPWTIAKASTNIISRPGYYKMHVVSGEWTYRWQPSAQSTHEFSPLTLKYQFMNSSTEKFDSIVVFNPYLLATMSDYFIPQMRYTYIYHSPQRMLNPIRWEITVAEAGNFTSLGFLMGGRKWNERDKQLFKNPYSQFVRMETDFTKTWRLNSNSQLVAHLNAGVIYSFGNSEFAPFTESFYVGGANSIRAYPVRSIGPGRFDGTALNTQSSYLLQNGDVKFLANLEYRPRLFGNLYGALYLDAGNVWNFGEDYDDVDLNNLFRDTGFKPSRLFSQMAVGTGVGLRYDLDFLILRLDWGIGLHVPYETGRSGFFNVGRFRDNQTLHFAIGYPF